MDWWLQAGERELLKCVWWTYRICTYSHGWKYLYHVMQVFLRHKSIYSSVNLWCNSTAFILRIISCSILFEYYCLLNNSKHLCWFQSSTFTKILNHKFQDKSLCNSKIAFLLLMHPACYKLYQNITAVIKKAVWKSQQSVKQFGIRSSRVW